MDPNRIQQYAEFLKDKGYSKRTIHCYSKALEQAPETWNTQVPQEIHEHITKTLATAKMNLTPTNRNNIKPASSLLFLMIAGITLKEYSRRHPQRSLHADILDEFFEYSTEFKGITILSAQAEQQHVKVFLEYIGNSSVSALSELKAEHLRDYVCDKLTDVRPSSKGRYVTSLRNFFRFLEYKGVPINHSVLDLPLAPAEWKKKNVPIILRADEETRLRNHYNRDTVNDKRNRVIICLMLDLGMRCAEVADLKISDFQWSIGAIKLTNTKNKRVRVLPISVELGNIIEDYIVSYRPNTKDDYLLQCERFNNQYKAMSRECVRGVVRRAFHKEGIKGWWKGTHALRRTAASHIYNTGNGLKLAADLLGHESLDSTAQYVKIDFESLRKVGLPWPGGDSNDWK